MFSGHVVDDLVFFGDSFFDKCCIFAACDLLTLGAFLLPTTLDDTRFNYVAQ
jgi:hypothetical protein